MQKDVFEYEAKIDPEDDSWQVTFTLTDFGKELVDSFKVDKPTKETHTYMFGADRRERTLVRRLIADFHDVNSPLGAFWDKERLGSGVAVMKCSDNVKVRQYLIESKQMFETMMKNKAALTKEYRGKLTATLTDDDGIQKS